MSANVRLNQKQAAKFLKVSAKTIARWTQDEKLKGHQAKSGRFYYDKEELINKQGISNVLEEINQKLDWIIERLNI